MVSPTLNINFKLKKLIFEGSEKLEIPLKDRPNTAREDDLEAILTPNDLDHLARLKGDLDVKIIFE